MSATITNYLGVDCKIDLLTGKRNRLIRHAVALSCIIILFICSNENPIALEPYITFLKIAFTIYIVGACYINMYCLVPRFLLKNKMLHYFAGMLAFILTTTVFILTARTMMSVFFHNIPETAVISLRIIPFITISVVFMTSSSAIKLFQQWIIDDKRIAELTQENMKSELEQLKSKVNPHFLFNSLNNVHVLTQIDPEKASKVLMNLSDLLRYQLHDSSRNKVLLSSDISFLDNFLNLEKIRQDNFEYKLHKEGEIIGIQIPPFLFINFVENAVKHSVDHEKASYADISISVCEHKISFTCTNSKPSKKLRPNVAGGLGLANAKRRLDLLYGDNHSLDIREEADTYTVKLELTR